MPISYQKDREKQYAQKKQAEARFYNLNSMLGNRCMFYIVIGGRMTGKSYSGGEFLTKQKRELKDDCKNYWFRISESSVKKMKADNCRGFIDPDIQRRYKLNLTSKGMYVKNHGKDWLTVMSLSSMGKDKGIGFFDKDFKGWYNIIFDEFQLEEGEKRTSFDILYNFIGQLENTLRTSKDKVRVFLFGNTLEEASTILKAFNFIPQKFGRFYLHRWNRYTQKRELYAVIDNLAPTEEYLRDREGSAADILGGKALSNYTNELTKDTDLITKKRLVRPEHILQFTTKKSDWYTIWNDNIIRPYNKEQTKSIIAMRPGLHAQFSREIRQGIIETFDARAYRFRNYIDQQYFCDAMMSLRPKN